MCGVCIMLYSLMFLIKLKYKFIMFVCGRTCGCWCILGCVVMLVDVVELVG